MSVHALVPAPDRLHLVSLAATADGITLIAQTHGDTACCPLCGQLSARVHSRYRRTLADLPWQGIPARVLLWTRRFFCGTPDCPRCIFTERLPGVAAPHARCTDRLRDWFTHVSFALGGEAGARLLHALGVTVSGDALLAHVRAFTFPPRPTPRVLSVDDFALRRGRTYGSILVDLERHRVVDLLPDRSANTFAAWLEAHPGTEIISRDRGGEYAEGARRGAPQAVQVADRFHLLRNLRDVMLRIFKRHTKHIAQVPVPGTSPVALTRLRLDREASRERTRAEMQDRFEALQQLATQGMKGAAIARALGFHRHTVQKYLASDAVPERRHTTRKTSALTPYQGYILERWQAGSPIWHLLYSFPPNDFAAVEQGYVDFANRWHPILDVYRDLGVRFALEVHPTEIAYDFVTTRKALDALGHRPEFGINFDPSHFAHQFLDSAAFVTDFADRIYHVHVKDSKKHLDGRTSILGSHLNFGDPRRGWDFVSPGHGDVAFEPLFRALNRIGYQGPLSIEWEDSGMDRDWGAPDALAFVRRTDFAPSSVAFDAAFQRP